MAKAKVSRTLFIGLTGAPGAGKSAALSFIKSAGIPTLQTDRLGHQLLREKTFRDRLVSLFGKGILGKKGRVDRAKLAEVVFQDGRQQYRLNRTTHPEIRRRVGVWAKKLASRLRPPRLAVVEVPLIYEGGYYRWFDGVLCISAQTRKRRLRLARRGWTAAESLRREKLQWSARKREMSSNWVVRNNKDIPTLHRELKKWLKRMDGKSARSWKTEYFGKQ